jgi:hypothetical protein
VDGQVINNYKYRLYVDGQVINNLGYS